MSLKTLLIALLVTASFTVSAQDKIYKNNGDVIPGKVKKVTPRSISYKRQDNPDGPDYTIGRNEVSMIEYENGAKESMKRGPLPGGRQIPGRDTGPKLPVNSADYGMNILSVSPICINEAGIGIGLAFERMLDKKGQFTFFLPLSYHVGGFQKSYNDAAPVSFLDGFGKQIRVLNFNAGVKFYPTGSRGKIRYALGVLFNCQYGQEFEGGSGSVPPYSSYIPPADKVVIQRAGFLINNSLNLSLTKRFYMGLDVGYGITAINRREQPYTTNMVGQGSEALMQGNFRLGYRF